LLIFEYEESTYTIFEKVFTEYYKDDLESVKSGLAKLETQHANYIRKFLAFLALKERRAEVLRYCLEEGGFAFEGYFEDEADRYQNQCVKERRKGEDVLWRVLEGSEFRRLFPWKEGEEGEGGEGDGEGDGEEDVDSSEDFDVGGRFPVEW